MTAYYTNSDITTNTYGTPVFNLADDDTLYVGEKATIAALGADANTIQTQTVDASFDITINGDLYSAHRSTIRAGSTTAGPSDRFITIGETASLTAHNGSGVSLLSAAAESGNALIVNAGFIRGGYDAISVYGGAFNTITNARSGQLTGGQGITLIGAGRIINDGSILGGLNSGIQVGGGSHGIMNTGTISGNFCGILVDDGDTTIENQGAISAYEQNAIWLETGAHEIRNTGTITSERSAIWASSVCAGVEIENAGIIESGESGILIETSGNHSIVNGGQIHGGDIGIAVIGSSRVTNNGELLGGTDGLKVGDGTHALINTGTISGGGNAIQVASGSAYVSIDNFGTIGRIYLVPGTAALTLNNRGTITGLPGGAALDAAGGVEVITNTGLISGDVFLYGGDDLIDSTHGTVAGDVDGGQGNDTLIGGESADRLFGDSGADVLTGNSGADWLYGGWGIDSIEGGEGDDRLWGDLDDDRLYGNDGADMLDGGIGGDTAEGGAGNDQYWVDSTADAIFEDPGGGIDTVLAKVSYTLAPGEEIENLRAAGPLISFYTLTGNEFANNIRGGLFGDVLRGGEGNDRLDGLGGNDVMEGGEGDDIFFVDSAGDKVVELAGEGTDRVHASVSYTLGVGQEVETLATADRYGTSVINLTGNELANRIVGNAGVNVLNGGAGADTMAGGAGNDIYMVDNAGDRVFEAVDAGIDRVHSSISFVLGANVENLALTGTAAINGTGNGLANTLTGNAAVNVLNGAAGNDVLNGATGNDWLTGGAGLDSFLFNTALSASANVDTISDFSHADDTIRLSKTVFTAFAAQPPNTVLAAGALADWNAAGEADDRILYRHLDGPDADATKDYILLYYDANGGADTDAVLFAKLTNQASVTLAANDFLIVA